MAESRKVLTDHVRKGQKLIPPFTHMMGPMRDVSWVKTIIPEVVWIGLIQYQHGHQRGVELVTSMARSARAIFSDAERKMFAAASSYSGLSHSEAQQLRSDLATTKGDLFELQDSLSPLVSWYPCCPLHLIFARPTVDPSVDGLGKIKSLISSLYSRCDRDPMMVQATVVWLAFDADMLKVQEGLPLAQFPEIEKYPDTELSRKIGSGIRAALNGFFSLIQDSPQCGWTQYFWNRGIEIDGCEFNDV